MITIHSLLKVADELVPVEDFTGPILDEDYIEGAIELFVDQKPILSREQVDLVDQLWAYLVEGLEQLAVGREFSTYFPDMPVEIVLQPLGHRVTIKVNNRVSTAEATVTLAELRAAMVPAATLFFQRMRPHVAQSQATYDRYLARLSAIDSDGH
jgi:hypothetical protein